MPYDKTLRKLTNFDTDKQCFACGPENEAGLRMEFFTDGETVYSWLKVPPHLCGWQQIVHGGIVTAIMDEVMSWTAHHLIRKIILTKSIQVEFHRPLRVDREIRAEGRIYRLTGENEAELEATIVDAADRAYASARATFALLTARVALRLGVIDDRVAKNFEQFIATPTD